MSSDTIHTTLGKLKTDADKFKRCNMALGLAAEDAARNMRMLAVAWANLTNTGRLLKRPDRQ